MKKKIYYTAIVIIIAIIMFTNSVNNLSQASDLNVGLGLLEIVLTLILLINLKNTWNQKQ